MSTCQPSVADLYVGGLTAAASLPGRGNTIAHESNSRYTRQGNPELGRLTGREKEFQELGDLTALYEGLSTKTRQHVNPLADHFQVPTQAPDWTAIFENPTLPLHVDVGCGSGRFVLIRAQRLAGQVNVIGMEIRQKLVDRAQAWAGRLSLRNCHFVFTNATVSWNSLLRSYPGPIELVSMQFPDPHFKARHRKRRHVQPGLVREMAETLAPGARVFLQGDVPEAVRWMRDMIEVHGGKRFDLAPECRNQEGLLRDEWESSGNDQDGPLASGQTGDADQDVNLDVNEDPQDIVDSQSEQGQLPVTWSADPAAGWLPVNPLGVPSDREVYVAQSEAMVYRLMLVRR